MSERNSPSRVEIDALAYFAEQHGEMEFFQLCVEALRGQYWATVRIGHALAATNDTDRLEAIRNADTVRVRVGQMIGGWRVAAIGPCIFLGTPIQDGEVFLVSPSDAEYACLKQIDDLSESVAL